VTRLPPPLVRRTVLAPLVVALDLLVLALVPVLVPVARAAAPLVGGSRALRMVLIVAAGAAAHLEAVLALFGLWVRSGFGRRMDSEAMRTAHYAVMRRFVGHLYRAIVHHARVEVRYTESPAADRALSGEGGRPVVLLGRHAGEGDTLLVLHELLCRHERTPRVVMHHALQVEPLVDGLGNRLPNRFVDPRGGDTEVEIAALASDLDDRSVLVIFPEGTNFSEEGRRRGIDRLARAGFAREAERAEGIRHLSPPRPGGALAAIDAAPGADVVIMGHAGFPTGLREVWRLLPAHQPIDVAVWHVPAEEVPAEHSARIAWLFDEWVRLDAWVAERTPGG
jgi:1-acyl-sn-glycerol-3-phosphate acyltransferase